MIVHFSSSFLIFILTKRMPFPLTAMLENIPGLNFLFITYFGLVSILNSLGCLIAYISVFFLPVQIIVFLSSSSVFFKKIISCPLTGIPLAAIIDLEVDVKPKMAHSDS